MHWLGPQWVAGDRTDRNSWFTAFTLKRMFIVTPVCELCSQVALIRDGFRYLRSGYSDWDTLLAYSMKLCGKVPEL